MLCTMGHSASGVEWVEVMGQCDQLRGPSTSLRVRILGVVVKKAVVLRTMPTLERFPYRCGVDAVVQHRFP